MITIFKNDFRLLALIASYACGIVGSCAADNQATRPDNADAATITVQSLPTSGLEPLRRIMITKGTNELVLIAPQNLRIGTCSPNKVTFAIRDLTFYISVRIIPPPSDLAKSEPLEINSGWVLENYSGARVTEELSMPTGAGDCKLFNFVWPRTGLSNRVGRIGLVQTATGLVEFTMLADPNHAKAASDDFHAVLCSLRTNEHGPIKFPRLPDHS